MRIFALLFLWCCVCFAHAQQAQEEAEWWFDIEVIVFDRNQTFQSIAEQFEYQTAIKPINADLDLITQLRKPNVSMLYQSLGSCLPTKPIPLDVYTLPEWKEPIWATQQQATQQDHAAFGDGSSLEQALGEPIDLSAKKNAATVDNTEDVPLESYTDIENWLFFNAPEFIAEPTDLISFPQVGCVASSGQYNPLAHANFAVLPVNHYGVSHDETWGPGLLSREDLALEELSLRIRSERGLTRLLHVAWRQQVKFGKDNADSVRIFGGTNFSLYFDDHGEPISDAGPLLEVTNQQTIIEKFEQQLDIAESVSELNNKALQAFNNDLGSALIETTELEVNTTAQPSHSEIWQLDGLLTVFLQRVNRIPYLHIDGEINYRQTQSGHTDSLAQDKLLSIVDKPFRRVVSTQLHYFDHPMYGMLVEIRRFKTP